MSTAVTLRPAPAASNAAPDGPLARSATGPSGGGTDSARTASGWGENEAPGPSEYRAFHRSRSGWLASSSPGSRTPAHATGGPGPGGVGDLRREARDPPSAGTARPG